MALRACPDQGAAYSVSMGRKRKVPATSWPLQRTNTICILISILLVLGASGYLYWEKKQLKENPKPTPAQSLHDPLRHGDGTATR